MNIEKTTLIIGGSWCFDFKWKDLKKLNSFPENWKNIIFTKYKTTFTIWIYGNRYYSEKIDYKGNLGETWEYLFSKLRKEHKTGTQPELI